MEPEGTVLFTTVGLTYFGFDIFSVSLPPNPSDISIQSTPETCHTDGISANFNAGFVDDESNSVVFVSERAGYSQLYITRYGKSEPEPIRTGVHSIFHDRPTIRNQRLYFVSAHEKPSEPLKSWGAVYEARLDCMEPQLVRLSPAGTVDLSPAVSQSGELMAVASHGSGRWKGDFRELETEIVVFPVADPAKRRVVVGLGGWPTWQGDSVLFFHRKAEDGWWSIFQIDASGGPATRVTPPGVHALTPVASHNGRWIAVATRRKGKPHRHIELFDLKTEQFYQVTEKLNPNLHHYNPFFSADSDRLGYHRFRGESAKGDCIVPHLQPTYSPVRSLRMLRVHGTFPSFSPDGGLIAINGDLTNTAGLMILKSDGSKRWVLMNEPFIFATAWSPTESGVIFTSVGPIFESVKMTVQIARVSFNISDLENTKSLTDADNKIDVSIKILTSIDKGNNAFPSCSPDGKRIVFRSGRSGYKNLYIVDAVNGEGENGEGIFRLTEGDWIDTMPSWSPDGEFIAFSSNRRDPADPNGFGLYLVRPDGTDLRRVQIKGQDTDADLAMERINHVCFSPDSKWLLFTANFGAVLAETISGPNQFQPYGELYTCRVDGSGLVRLTCNQYEDGTPAWKSGIAGFEELSLAEPVGDKLRGQFDEPLWLSCDI
jgi:Tol biopolymer transport system component